eukprot:1147404-Pelagomonas_calceolata.AAC.1
MDVHQLGKKRHIGSNEPEVPSTKKKEQKGLVGTWRVAGGNRLQNLAERSTSVFICAPRGNKGLRIL